MSKENSLTPVVNALKHKMRNRSVVGRIMNVMEALGFETKSGQTPVLVKKQKTNYGWYLIFHLPAGISTRDIEQKLNYFEEQVGGVIDLSNKGSNIFMDIYLGELESNIPYHFEPGNQKKKHITLPIGYGLSNKLLTANFPDIPHLLVSGNTRAGKTNALHTISLSMLEQNVILCVIDLAKTEFSYLRKHAVVATEEQEAAQLLELLIKESKNRFKRFEQYDCFKWQEYPKDDLPYVVLIIDELGHLEDKDCQYSLRKLAQICGGAGMSIILATQRPSATTFKNFTDIRALFPAVLCFAIKDKVNSQIILDNDHATKIPKTAKGRAIWQWDDEVMVQTMHLPSKQARSLVSGLPHLKGVDWIESRAVRLPPR